MASTYSNTGIELIADGEQSTTWGDTTNTNWELMEELATGVVSIALSASTYTLTTTDGATSNGRHAVVKFTGSPGGTCTVTVSPSDMQKVYFIVNSSDQTVTLTQGSGGNVSVSAGKTKVVYCDGAGGTAAVVDISGGFDSTTLAELGVTASAAELNTMDGITATTAELNTMDGITATTAELNIMDGVTATYAELNTMDGITATTAELNILDGVTATAAEINILDGVTATTAELNIMDGVTATTAELNIMDGVTATTTEINKLDGVTATTAELNILNGVTASTAEINILDGVTATTAELNYVDGVTSNIQTQINNINTDLVNDTTPQLGGNLASNGNDILMADNDVIKVGTGNDLNIYHNGSNSYIDEAGTGHLAIRSSETQIQKYTGEICATFVGDGSVSLYHDNSKKLETTSSGVTVTGSVTATNVGVTQGSNKSATGTSVSWSIPSGVKRVSLQAWDVSMSGSNYPKVRLGTSSGVVSSGYRGRAVVNCGAGGTNSVDISDAVPLLMGGGGSFYLVGNYTMTRVGTTNNWIIDGVHLFNCAGFSTGRINLPAELDRVEVLLSGSDSFDAGSFGVSWEY